MFKIKRIPPGFVRCKTCGDFSGTTFEKYLSRYPNGYDDMNYQPDRQVTALCRCHGPLCRSCGVNRVHRPISERYDEEINAVTHVPHFAVGASCGPCAAQARLTDFQKTQASLGPQDRAVHIPCELRPGHSARHGNFHMFTLDADRLAWVSAMVVMPTYASLVSGLPDPESDAELILQARKRARYLWGERPTHVITPRNQYAVEDGRTFLRMPPWEYQAWVESGSIKRSVKQSSQLVVIWFGQRNGYISLLEEIERSLRSLPWEALAGGCDP